MLQARKQSLGEKKEFPQDHTANNQQGKIQTQAAHKISILDP